MQFNDLLSAIAATVRAKLPELRACEPHEGRFSLAELKRVATQSPAVFVACLGVSGLSDPGTEERDAELSLAAYVVARRSGSVSQGAAALNIVEALLLLADSEKWGMSGVGSGTGARADNLYNGDVGRHGVAMWAVSWRQKVRIGTNIWTSEGTLPSTLYVGWDPAVGPESEGDYEVINAE